MVFHSAPGNATLQFLRENYEWMKAQTDLHHETDDYWFTARGILHQLEGMLEGLKEGCPALRERKEAAAVELSSLRYPTLLHLLLLNADGDLFQIADKFSEFSRDSSRRPHEGAYDAKGGNSMRRRLLKHHRMKGSRRHEHCSAMIKLLPDGSDVVFGHSTWYDFNFFLFNFFMTV